MKKNLAIIAMLGLGMHLAVSAYADPPPWAPAHGHRAKEVREYRYVYYPAQRVYYAPEQQTWFWMNGSNWQFGVNLPSQVRVGSSGGVPVVLQTSRPYVEHVYVEERYGRPWREKHKHKHKHKDKHEHKHEHKHHKHHDRDH